MRFTKKLFLFLALSLTANIVSAQQTNAHEIMSRAERQIYTAKSGEAAFTSVYYDAKGNVQGKQSGVLYLQGERFRLEYGEIVAVFDGTTLTHHDASEETFTISKPSPEELLQINPLHFLRSRGRGFTVELTSQSKGIQSLRYKPQGKSSVQEITIGYRQSDALPQYIWLQAKDKSRVALQVNAFNPNSELYHQSKFTLKKSDYPNSELVDLR